MKTFAPLFVVAAMAVAGSHAHAECEHSVTLDEAIASARDAFTTSYDAYLFAHYEANYLRSFNLKYYRNYHTAANYWSISADYQYRACLNAYHAWSALMSWKNAVEKYGPRNGWTYWDPNLWDYAETGRNQSAWAGMYAVAAERTAGFDYYPALQRAFDSHEKMGALVDAVHCYDPTALPVPKIVVPK